MLNPQRRLHATSKYIDAYLTSSGENDLMFVYDNCRRIRVPVLLHSQADGCVYPIHFARNVKKTLYLAGLFDGTDEPTALTGSQV